MATQKQSTKLTKERLQIIIDALNYWETMIDDGEGWYWETDAQYKRAKQECEKACEWAHNQRAKRQKGSDE